MISEPENLPKNDKKQDVSAAEATEPESKSQRKRDARQITDLARQLVAMKPRALAALPLDPDIREAIRHCAEIKSNGAKKRQLQFVSKLLRANENIDRLKSNLSKPEMLQTRNIKPEVAQPGLAQGVSAAPALETVQQTAVNPHLAFRNQLLADFAGTVEALRENYPGIELQRIRQLVRNAHNECKQARAAEAETDAATEATPHNTRAAESLLKLLQSGS